MQNPETPKLEKPASSFLLPINISIYRHFYVPNCEAVGKLEPTDFEILPTKKSQKGRLNWIKLSSIYKRD
jgi:hypothetical protein